VNGTNTQLFVQAENGGLPAIVYGYDSTNGSIPSSFSSNFLVKGDGTASSPAITFSTAPTVTVGGARYFVFVLDSQEQNNQELLSIDDVTITANNQVVWSMADTIRLNSAAPFTLTVQSNGADMAFYVPVAAFNGFGLTGSSTFIFTATHSLSSGGNEEWLFTDRGIPSAITFFATNAPIVDIVVPEPSTIWTGAFSLLAIVALSRRRMKA